MISRITDARVDGHAGACHLGLGGGRVHEVVAGFREAPAEGEEPSLAAGGNVVIPALVDAHVHLDKAFLLAAVEEEGGAAPSSLGDAIAAVARLRDRLPLEAVRRGAERAIDRLVAQGVAAARAHVEIDPAVGLDLVHLHRELADRERHRITLELVAFPQRGLQAPGMTDLFAAAMDLGLGVVGGCPYVDDDPGWHLDRVFALAERHGAPVDLHLDFSDDPGRSLLDLVVARTRAHGMQGRVTIGHVTTLAAMPPEAQARALASLAEAGIALVVLPATDLYLAGHGEPGTRSLAPWERAIEAGVRVAIANNNLENPFAPFGNGNLLQAAWLAGITRRAASPAQGRALLDAITRVPAAILGLPPHGPRPGAVAHLAVVEDDEPTRVVLRAPSVLATLHGGRLVSVRRALDLRPSVSLKDRSS